MRELDRATHPTVHEVVVGDLPIPIEGERVSPHGITGRLRRLLSDFSLRRDVRRLLGYLFDPRHSGLSASTTLCGVAFADDEASIRMRLDNGAGVVIAIHTFDGMLTYSVGHDRDGTPLWSDRERLDRLVSRFGRGSPLTARLLA
jgi:hypothetical protein